MQEKVFISLALDELQSLIINCVNTCLKHSQGHNSEKPIADQLLTIDEAAQFLTLKKPTIYSMVQRREIPVNKKGNRLYFSQAELIDWVKGGRKLTSQELDVKANSYRKLKK